MADENNKVALEMFNKLKVPASMVVTGVCFTIGYSLTDLIRLFWFGYPLRESTLMITATTGLISIVGCILLGNGINNIKKHIL